MAPAVQFFETPQAMRAWLRKNHARAPELLVGYYKKDYCVAAGKRSITWPQSVEEALCFGWIDGIRRSLDENSYSIRFTPRRPKSKWSAINLRLMAELEAAGRMTVAGRNALQARKDAGDGYKAQKKIGELDASRVKLFKKNKSAWEFFSAQPPGYRRMLAWWVMQAKLDETRDRRLSKLIETSAKHRRLE